MASRQLSVCWSSPGQSPSSCTRYLCGSVKPGPWLSSFPSASSCTSSFAICAGTDNPHHTTDGSSMPRKTRKELTDIDEEEAGKQRREAYRRLESELHRVWHTQRSAGAHT